MDNKITLPVSLNPGLKAWGLSTMNSLRKSLDNNNEEVKSGSKKKIKIIRKKDKIIGNKEESETLENINDIMLGGNSFYKQLLMPNLDFKKLIN